MTSINLDLLFTALVSVALIVAGGLALTLLPWGSDEIKHNARAWGRVRHKAEHNLKRPIPIRTASVARGK